MVRIHIDLTLKLRSPVSESKALRRRSMRLSFREGGWNWNPRRSLRGPHTPKREFSRLKVKKQKGKKGRKGRPYAANEETFQTWDDGWNAQSEWDSGWQEPSTYSSEEWTLKGKGRKGKKGKSKGFGKGKTWKGKGKSKDKSKGKDDNNANATDSQSQSGQPESRLYEPDWTGQDEWSSWDYSESYAGWEEGDYSWDADSWEPGAFPVEVVQSSLEQQCFITKCGRPYALSNEQNDYDWKATYNASLRNLVDFNKSPTCVILDLGCTRAMGSRRAVEAFEQAVYKFGITCEWKRCWTRMFFCKL